MESKSSNKKIGIGLGVVVVAVVVITFLGKNSSYQTSTNNMSNNQQPVTVNPVANDTTGNNSSSTQNTSQVSNNVVDTTKNSASSYVYKNGTYTAVGSYMSPGGLDKISVTLTIKNDVVTDSSVTPMPGDNTSAKYQNIFATNYQSQVVGQNLSGLNLTKVSRSSLTSKGFDDALSQIQSQAKA